MSLPPPASEPLAIPFVKALVLAPASGSFLLQRRAKAGRYQGCWELPGGRIRDGETLEQAVARELAEEVGLELRALVCAPGEPPHLEARDAIGGRARLVEPLLTIEVLEAGTPLFGHYFACLTHGETRRTEEAHSHRWIRPAEFAEEFFFRDREAASTLGDTCSTIDLLALRILLRDGVLARLLRDQSRRRSS